MMTYNFDPERWHENEYSALETLHKNGTITGSEFEERCSNLLRRYEEMLSRLDGTYQIPKQLPRKETGMTIKQELKKLQIQYKALGQKMEKLTKAIEKTEKAPAKKVATKKTKTTKAKPKSPAAKKPARKKPVKKVK